MTTCDERGFTLIEVIVVLGVVGILIATAVPMASAVVDAGRRQEARRELENLEGALDAYWFDRAAFPGALNDADFLGVYLQAGPQNTAVADPFRNQGYRYFVDAAGTTATVYSVGENGVDDGEALEEYVLRVRADVPGIRRTWLRMRLIVELLAEHIEAGGSVVGTWSTVRSAIGLGASFELDGFGTAFSWQDSTHTLSSAGPDRTLGTVDDIVL